MEKDASWSTTWEKDAVPDYTFEEMSSRIPQGKTLVARIFGEPSPGVREPRVTFLCVDQHGVLVTRTETGALLWSRPNPNLSADDGSSRAFPDDPGAECEAMVDGWHLVEWLNSTRYTFDEGQLTGQAEYYGPFVATINRAHGFVSEVSVQIGTPLARRLVEVQAWRLLDHEPELLQPVAFDLRDRLNLDPPA